MTRVLRTTALLVRSGFRQQTTYRLALLAGISTNSVFGIIRAAIALATVASAGAAVGGYDARTAAAFVWWGQALLGTINLWGFSLVADRVRSGDIAVDFLRPVNPMLVYLAGDVGRAGVGLVARAIPTLAIGALLFDLAWPPGMPSAALGLLSILLAVVVAFLGAFSLNLSALWFTEIRGLRLAWMVVGGVLCGLYLPLPWFPGWVQAVASCTPFPSMLQHPLDILSGRIAGADAVSAVVSQLFWVLVLTVVGQWVLALGRRRVEVQGG